MIPGIWPIAVFIGVVLTAVVVGSLRLGSSKPRSLVFHAFPVGFGLSVMGAILSHEYKGHLGAIVLQLGLAVFVIQLVVLVGTVIAATEDGVALRRIDGPAARDRERSSR